MSEQRQVRLELTTRERVELIAEAFITLAIVFLIYLGMLFVFNQLLDNPVAFIDQQKTLRELWQLDRQTIVFFRQIFTWGSAIFGVGLTAWRLMRRYNQMQLNHVLNELHYIANGHFDYRIPFHLLGNMDKVVKSINVLVESTSQAMAEERRIEQSKDELVTSVSHDLRTPLTSLLGYLDLVQNKQYASDEERERYCTIAYQKAQQMKSLVDDLFEYTTMRHTIQVLNKQALPLEPFLQQKAADFELQASAQAMAIHVHVATKHLMLYCEPNKIARVFDNLISNALKYGVGGTAVWLEADEGVDTVLLTVRNDGPAIPQEALAHLFERFYRVDYSRSSRTGGSGLGLAIAQSIVEQHDGTITVVSDEAGTAFKIRLPK